MLKFFYPDDYSYYLHAPRFSTFQITKITHIASHVFYDSHRVFCLNFFIPTITLTTSTLFYSSNHEDRSYNESRFLRLTYQHVHSYNLHCWYEFTTSLTAKFLSWRLLLGKPWPSFLRLTPDFLLKFFYSDDHSCNDFFSTPGFLLQLLILTFTFF